MARPLRIPDRYQAGFHALAELSDEDAERLRAALAEPLDRITTSRLARHAAAAVPQLGDGTRDILDALQSLVPLLPEDDDAIASALAEDLSQSRDLDLEEDTRARLADRVRTLIRLEPVLLGARAHDLATEYDRVFHGARVLTDLRPVFGQDVGEGAKAATLLGVLKIDAHEQAGGDLTSYYFALDHGDLLELQAVIERALAKHVVMKDLVERMGLPYWEYRELDDAAGT